MCTSPAYDMWLFNKRFIEEEKKRNGNVLIKMATRHGHYHEEHYGSFLTSATLANQRLSIFQVS